MISGIIVFRTDERIRRLLDLFAQTASGSRSEVIRHSLEQTLTPEGFNAYRPLMSGAYRPDH